MDNSLFFDTSRLCLGVVHFQHPQMYDRNTNCISEIYTNSLPFIMLTLLLIFLLTVFMRPILQFKFKPNIN